MGVNEVTWWTLRIQAQQAVSAVGPAKTASSRMVVGGSRVCGVCVCVYRQTLLVKGFFFLSFVEQRVRKRGAKVVC